MQRVAVLVVLTFLSAACAGAGEGGKAAGTASARSAASAPPARQPDAAARAGAVGDGDARASCVEGYSPSAVARRSFAFDGTVVDVGPGTTNEPDTGTLDTVAVTFDVNEWFAGGAQQRVTVDVMSPTTSASSSGRSAYDAGTRLLVSGEPRWGGEPLTDAIAWSCGFTRYYEATVADEWRRAAS